MFLLAFIAFARESTVSKSMKNMSLSNMSGKHPKINLDCSMLNITINENIYYICNKKSGTIRFSELSNYEFQAYYQINIFNESSIDLEQFPNFTNVFRYYEKVIATLYNFWNLTFGDRFIEQTNYSNLMITYDFFENEDASESYICPWENETINEFSNGKKLLETLKDSKWRKLCILNSAYLYRNNQLHGEYVQFSLLSGIIILVISIIVIIVIIVSIFLIVKCRRGKSYFGNSLSA